MAEDKSSGKWVAEAFDFIRLFQRIGGQISGLLALEIGWTLLLFLVTKLSPTNSTPILGLPWLSSNLQMYIIDIRLTSLFTVGALAIALMWFFSSGTYLYLFIPVNQILRVIAIVVLHILFIVVLIVIGLPSFLISLPYELYLIRKWERKQDPEKLKIAVEKNGEKAVLDFARKKIQFTSSWLSERIGDTYISLLVMLASVGRIGLAPLYSYSFEEDQVAAKAPLQIFANAIGLLRLKLGTLDAIQYIRFQTLPSTIKIATYERARNMRKWLALDALLWGSYLSTKPPKIWLNIEQSLTKKTPSGNTSEERRNYDPFRPLIDLDQYMLVINQDDPFDTYIALLISLILSLRARRNQKFSLYQKGADKLYYSSTDEDEIFTSLIKDALFAVSSPILHEPSQPSAKQLLINIAGKWIAKQLDGGYFDKFADNHNLLKDVAVQCVTLLPNDANAHYRLAAIYCLLGDENNARQTLRNGQEKDNDVHWLNRFYLESMAVVELVALGRAYTNEKVQMAKLVAYTARAIAREGTSAKESIRSEFKKTIFYDLRESGINSDPPSVSEKIFYELLDIKFADSIP